MGQCLGASAAACALVLYCIELIVMCGAIVNNNDTNICGTLFPPSYLSFFLFFILTCILSFFLSFFLSYVEFPSDEAAAACMKAYASVTHVDQVNGFYI